MAKWGQFRSVLLPGELPELGVSRALGFGMVDKEMSFQQSEEDLSQLATELTQHPTEEGTWFIKPLSLNQGSLPKWEQGYVRIIKSKAYFNTTGIIYGFYHKKLQWQRIRKHPKKARISV